jgi:hypothetical protein
MLVFGNGLGIAGPTTPPRRHPQREHFPPLRAWTRADERTRPSASAGHLFSSLVPTHASRPAQADNAGLGSVGVAAGPLGGRPPKRLAK